MTFAQLSSCFQSLLLLPTSELYLSSANSWVSELVYILGPYGPLQEWTLVRPGVSPVATPIDFYSQWFWSFSFPRWIPGLRSLFPTCSPLVPPGLSTCKCGTSGLPATALLHFLSAPVAHLCPSCWSGWMFLLYFLGCRTFIQFDFLAVLVVFCF